MTNLRFAMFGAGFWSSYQLHGWREVGGVDCVAICDPNRDKVVAQVEKFGIPHGYDDPKLLLENEDLDFIDICTAVEAHAPIAKLAAERGLPVVCQKPMATTLEESSDLVEFCQSHNTPLFINENWRWQYPIRQFKRLLDEGRIGKPFRASIDMNSGYGVFQNQPFLAELEQFIITDLGTHTLDVARFLFGEATRLYCQTYRAHANIKGEDVATIILNMHNDMTVLVRMAYAENHLERECFPQTLMLVEGTHGSLELDVDYKIRETTAAGTLVKRYAPPRYDWANPFYDLIHSSIVPCQTNIAQALRGEGQAETTGEDNLKTLRLVFGAYDSARTRQAISLTS